MGQAKLDCQTGQTEVVLSDGADLGGIVRRGRRGGIVRRGRLRWDCQTGQTGVGLSDGAGEVGLSDRAD